MKGVKKQKQPTFIQQWILLMTPDNGLLYSSILWTDSFGPFRVQPQSQGMATLRRMEKSGWIDSTEKNCFWRITAQGYEWIKANKDKSYVDYSKEYFKLNK